MRGHIERIVFQEKLLAALPPLAPPERRRLRVQQGPGSGPIQKVLDLPESIEAMFRELYALFRNLGDSLQPLANTLQPLDDIARLKVLVVLDPRRQCVQKL